MEDVDVERPRLTWLSTNTKTPFFELYLTSLISAASAEIIGYPFDVTKTRMQIQGELATKTGEATKYRGMLATGIGIVKEEGLFKGMYGGISAMLLRHTIFSGLKMLFYDFLRNELMIENKDGTKTLTFMGSAVSGILAGAGAQIFTTPTDLIKVQMQMEGKRRLMGEPPRIHNVLHAFKTIYATGGVVGLWKGTVPSAWRAALVTLGDVSIYDLSKRNLMEAFNCQDTRAIQFAGAMIAGFAGAAISTPADVMKTRIMNQPTDDKGRGLLYKGMYDCFSKAVKEEGFLAMYKGFLPYWLRVGPWSMVFWMTFEQVRRFRGDEGY